MIDLPRVTLICVDCYFFGGAVSALKKSMEQCNFGAVKFLTNIPLKVDGVEVVQIPDINSKAEYSQFIIKELYKYFDTDFVLLIQHDGYVICADAWTDKFLEYDFIGAPWLYTDGRNVGNGGVSIRSRKLQLDIGLDDFIQISDPEDECIGRLYRNYLETVYHIKFPSEELADKFSFELKTPVAPTFAFHGSFHQPFQKTIVITRQASLGDIVACEPVLRYYHEKGYRVVLNTLPQFLNLFVQHYFPVWSLNAVDQRLLVNAEEKNLDLSYEAFPEKNHLQAYYDVCGIDAPLVKSKLTLSFDTKSKENKLFKKYATIHIDRRDNKQGRNIDGVNWREVVIYLKGLGYEVIHLGKGESEDMGAIRMNTPSEPFMMWVLGSSDLFIGIDSGLANVSVAMNVPAIIFFGSVSPEKIYPDLSNIEVIQNDGRCSTPKCWHQKVSTEGTPCIVDQNLPPCCQFDNIQVVNAINKLING